MRVSLITNTSLDVVVKAIRRCYCSEGKSDSEYNFIEKNWVFYLGPKDKKLIKQIISSDHTSTLEHLNFTFDIQGLSRAALQELARHRHASLSVKSTRYTLGEVWKHNCTEDCDICKLSDFLVQTTNYRINDDAREALCRIRLRLEEGLSNDVAKYILPEAFKTSLIWTINARSLRNFLKLRSSPRALREMQELAAEIYRLIPSDMAFMFEDCMAQRKDE